MGVQCYMNRSSFIIIGILAFAVVALLATHSTASNSMITGHTALEGVHHGPELCGNGILDPGENHTSCCVDAGCASGFVCREYLLERTHEEVYMCSKIVLPNGSLPRG